MTPCFTWAPACLVFGVRHPRPAHLHLHRFRTQPGGSRSRVSLIVRPSCYPHTTPLPLRRRRALTSRRSPPRPTTPDHARVASLPCTVRGDCLCVLCSFIYFVTCELYFPEGNRLQLHSLAAPRNKRTKTTHKNSQIRAKQMHSPRRRRRRPWANPCLPVAHAAGGSPSGMPRIMPCAAHLRRRSSAKQWPHSLLFY